MDKKPQNSNTKHSHRPMGVFQIRNMVNGKVFVDSSVNLAGKFNRYQVSA